MTLHLLIEAIRLPLQQQEKDDVLHHFRKFEKHNPQRMHMLLHLHVSMTSKADEGLTNSVKTYNTTQMAKTWRNEISDTGQDNYLAATNTTTQSQIQKQLE